jgi:hypothetical protein
MLPLLSLTTELLSLNPVVTERMTCCLPSRTKSMLSDIRILQPYSTVATENLDKQSQRPLAESLCGVDNVGVTEETFQLFPTSTVE